jgi:hypothetical protein
MKNENKLRLERMVAQYECETEAERAEDAEKARKKLEFIQEFEQLKSKMIIPVMKEIGSFLKTAGHDYRIEDKPAFNDRNGIPQLGMVEIEIIPGRPKNSTMRSPDPVCYSCVANYDGKIVTGTRDAGGTHNVQIIAEYTMEQLSAGLVEDQIMSLLERTLGVSKESTRLQEV